MGKIGKPQKSSKHKKIKKTFDIQYEEDFDFQPARKKQKLSNLPVEAEDLDKQEIPRKVQDIIHSKNALRQTDKQTRKKPKKKFSNASVVDAESGAKMERGVTKPLKSIPRFVQGKYEKDRDFIRRVELETHRVLMKTQMEEKYKIEIPDAGPLNPVMNPGVKKHTSERKKEKDRERKKKKLQAKREKRAEKTRDFSALRDDVQFGEVAMAPPSLTAKPRKADQEEGKARPGKKPLLLKDLMKGIDSASSPQPESKLHAVPKSQAHRQVGQTVKRKYLSPVQRQITDFQRQKAIDLYRKMKEQKLNRPK